jgi:hypothetical protein
MIRPADDFTAGPRWTRWCGPVAIEVFFDDPRHVRLDDNEEIIDRALAVKAYAGQGLHLLTMDTSVAVQVRMLDSEVHEVIPPLRAGGGAGRTETGPRQRSGACRR